MKTNNYHDLVDREEIAESVEYWNVRCKNACPNDPFIGKTVDEAVEYWKDQAKKTEKLDNALWTFAENADLLATDADMILVDGLLNHPERDRLRLIHDGSYYTHRIWFHIDSDNCVTVSPSICWMNDEFKQMSNQFATMSPHEQLDFLFQNFEVVYVQTRNVQNRDDIDVWIRDEQWDRETDYVGWDDIC